MKRAFILIALFYSCDQSSTFVDERTECEKALDHIQSCVGYRPYLKTCTFSVAEKIRSTPCDEFKELRR
jgi:hypothetical protein